MMSTSFATRLGSVDAATLTPLVRAALSDPSFVVTRHVAKALTGGFAGGTVGGYGTYRFSGTGRSGTTERPWSLIAKVLGAVEGVGSTGEREWNYWKREILAYQSGLLAHLPGGIAAPRCFGVVAHGNDEFWIWLEDIPDTGAEWELADYGRVAQHLGEFNGHYLTGAAPLPEQPWLTRGRVRNWLDIGAPVLDDLPAHLAGRTRRHWLSGAQAERVEKFWRGRNHLLTRLDRLPRSLCHHDAFRRNLFLTPGETVAIDWQIIGTGGVGEEIMVLCGITLQLMHLPPSAARDLEGEVFAGYLAGLRSAGWAGDEKLARFGYTASSALLGGVATIGLWPELSDAHGYLETEPLIGHPIDDIIDCWSELQDYFLDLGDEAIRLAETLPIPAPSGS